MTHSTIDNIVEFEDVQFEASQTFREKKVDPEKSTILYDELVALIEPLAIQNVRNIIKFIATYIDKNNNSLIISGPYLGLFFDEKRDGLGLFDLIHLDKKQVSDIVKKCPLIQSSFRTLNNPFFFLMTTLIMIYSKYPKNPIYCEAKELCKMYLVMRFYSSRQSHLWKLGCLKPVMDYTINNLSNKYLFKVEGSVYKVLKHLADGNDETVGEKLRETHLDKYFKYYITDISSKVNNTLGKLFDVYRKNALEKKYLNEEKETWDDENQTIKELSNVSAVIVNLTDRVYNNIRTSQIDESILRDATTITKIKSSTVKSTVEEILDTETSSLREIINLILQVFFIESSKNTSELVKSRYFASFCMAIYKVSNSKSSQILRIKQILDTWIRNYGSKYIRLNREATLINFRKAIYIYIVNNIIKYA